jgi:hypothetical protein
MDAGYLQDQTEVFFKIKRSTQLKKLMEAYCERQGKAVNSVRFLYDGERIQPTNTPNEVYLLGLHDILGTKRGHFVVSCGHCVLTSLSCLVCSSKWRMAIRSMSW